MIINFINILITSVVGVVVCSVVVGSNVVRTVDVISRIVVGSVVEPVSSVVNGTPLGYH